MGENGRSTLIGLDGAGAEHTAREIAQQPELWRQIAARPGENIDAFLGPLLGRDDLRIVLTGAGSSAFAGQVLAPHLAQTCRRRADPIATTDIVAGPHETLAEDVPTLLVSFARSGDSPESVAATDLADRRLGECHHLIVTCNADGRLARRHVGRAGSHVVTLPPAANDRGFAMTSSFTGMTLAAMLALGGVGPAAVVPSIAVAAEEVLTTRWANARAWAARRPARLVFLGSGALRGLAGEAALKALELTAGDVVALADSPLGFRHGPKAVLDDRTVVVVFISNDPYTRRYDLDIIAELRGSVAAENLLAVTGSDQAVEAGEVWGVPGVAGLPDVALALPAAVCAQMLALALSVACGRTPDNPFPSGQVNRVVQGVTIHPLPA